MDHNCSEKEYIDENVVKVGSKFMRMTKSQRMSYIRTKNLPYNLLKQFSYKNQRNVGRSNNDNDGFGGTVKETQDQVEDKPLELSPESKSKVNRLIDKKASQFYSKNLNSDFNLKRKMLESQIDQGFPLYIPKPEKP